MLKTYQVNARLPPVHYFPNEYAIVTNHSKFRKDFESKTFTTDIQGCYVCHNEADCIHHIIPIEDLGNNLNSNLMPLCSKHHLEVHNTNNLQLKLPSNLNRKLLKKKNKLLRKLLLHSSNSRFIEDRSFIYLHIEIDDAIKSLIRNGMSIRLEQYMKGLYSNGTIKSKS